LGDEKRKVARLEARLQTASQQAEENAQLRAQLKTQQSEVTELRKKVQLLLDGIPGSASTASTSGGRSASTASTTGSGGPSTTTGAPNRHVTNLAMQNHLLQLQLDDEKEAERNRLTEERNRAVREAVRRERERAQMVLLIASLGYPVQFSKEPPKDF